MLKVTKKKGKSACDCDRNLHVVVLLCPGRYVVG